MTRIFISYRRDDAAYPAQSIHEKLASHFGEADVFIDIDNIPIGVDFHEHLNEAVAQCDVLLAVIGDGWLDARDEVGERRLDNPNDFVRIEIEAALSRKIPVVPVLVGKAKVPHAAQLPDSLSHLARRSAAEVRSGRDFRNHLDRLVRGIEQSVNQAKRRAAVPPKQDEGDHVRIQPVPAAPKPADIITNSIGMELKLIPAGEFLMGSPDSDEMAIDRERPRHNVRITTPYYLGVHPVTQAAYETVMGHNPSDFTGNNRRPVEQITWFDAVGFCNKLSEVENMSPFYKFNGEHVSIVGGNGYRLPTEAEWEYACRAGTTTNWCCGDDDSQLKEYAWFDQNCDYTTHPVGEKKPNSWGLYDMHGNVSEWCWDWFGSDFYKQSLANDPNGPSMGECHVLRGGAFDGQSSVVRSAFRGLNVPTYRIYYNGFRLART